MPQDRPFRVEVPGLGIVEFPAGTSPEAMEQAITSALSPGRRASQPVNTAGDTEFGGAALFGSPEERRTVRRIAPIAASGLAASMTSGASLPVQAAIQGLIGAAGAGGNTAAEGGSGEDIARSATIGGLGGAGSGFAGGLMGNLGGFMRRIASPSSVTEEVASPILNQFGQSARTISTTRQVPPDLSGFSDAAMTGAHMLPNVMGMKPAARTAARAVGASAPAVQGVGKLFQAFQPGLPASLNALLALLNKR